MTKLVGEMLAALKCLSNDGNGCFKDWEDGQGRNIQLKLERTIRNAEKLVKTVKSSRKRQKQ